MMMEASFDTEESFDDPSCLTPQPVSPAKRQIKEVKETKTTVGALKLDPPLFSSLPILRSLVSFFFFSSHLLTLSQVSLALGLPFMLSFLTPQSVSLPNTNSCL